MLWPTRPVARSSDSSPGRERNLSELVSPLKMTFPAASKHVRVLEVAKLCVVAWPGGSTCVASAPRR